MRADKVEINRLPQEEHYEVRVDGQTVKGVRDYTVDPSKVNNSAVVTLQIETDKVLIDS